MGQRVGGEAEWLERKGRCSQATELRSSSES
jgi:hypothetical protein